MPSSRIGKQVGQVVAQHVAGDRDGVLAGLRSARGVNCAGVGRRQDADVQARGIVILQVSCRPWLDHLGVVGAVLRPARRSAGVLRGAGAVDRELHPVADGGVLGLACAPDVAGLRPHVGGGPCRRSSTTRTVPFAGDLEGLVVGAVFLGCLCHQADVRHAAHGARIEGPVLLQNSTTVW